MFASTDNHNTFSNVQNEGVHKSTEMTVALEGELSTTDVQKATNDHGLFALTAKWDNTAAIVEENKDQPFPERQPVDSTQSKHQMKLISQTQQTLPPTEENMAITMPFPDTHTLSATSKMQHLDFWPSHTTSKEEHKLADATIELTECLTHAI